MRYYKVDIWGYGGEWCWGSINAEQYEFWKDIDEDRLISHMIDPTDECDENPIFDDEDPRFIGEFYENDSIDHLNCATLDSAMIDIYEVENEEYGSASIGDHIVESTRWTDFIEKYPEAEDKAKYLDVEISKDVKYVFFGASIEKGGFGHYLISTENEIDINKLEFAITETPDGEDLLELIGYEDLEICNDGGDTNGKGYSASVWEQGIAQ
jgi:hypothetical protein